MKNKKDIFKILVATDFKLRYQNSILGVIWVVLKPFLLFLILYLVFSFLFGQKDPNYKLNLLLGIILFSFFSEGTKLGMESLLSRANVILKVNFPREIALYSAVSQSVISLFFNLIIFGLLWLFSGTSFHLSGLFYLVLYLFLLLIFIIALSFFFAIIYVKFRDLQAIWEVILSLLLYATPIIYPLSVIPEKYQKIVFLNPLAVIIHNARESLIKGGLPNFYHTLLVFVFISVLFLLGYLFFKANIKRVAEDF